MGDTGERLPAGIYTRISVDDGTDLATTRQEEDCRELAKRLGLEVFKVYQDSDYSAYKDIVRPEYEAMLSDLKAGKIGTIIFYKLDRLSRRPKVFEEFLDLIQATGGKFHSVVENLDVTNPAGLAMARIGLVFANMESETIALRLKRALKQQAELGKPPSGGKRPFGLTKDWKEKVPEEAALVEEAANRILKGESLHSICLDWQERGVKPPNGTKPMVPKTLRRILESPRICGLRQYHGEIVAKGEWPALLDEKTWRKINTLVKREPRGSYNPRTWLLTGIITCGQCGSLMVAHKKDKNNKDRYNCMKRVGYSACGKTHIIAEPVEQIVWDAICERFSDDKLKEIISRDTEQASNGKAGELTAQIAESELSLEELTRNYTFDKVISRETFLKLAAELNEKIEKARKELESLRASIVLDDLKPGETLAQAWYDRPLSWKKALIQRLIDKVVIGPSTTPGRNKFDPTRVRDIIWKQ